MIASAIWEKHDVRATSILRRLGAVQQRQLQRRAGSLKSQQPCRHQTPTFRNRSRSLKYFLAGSGFRCLRLRRRSLSAQQGQNSASQVSGFAQPAPEHHRLMRSNPSDGHRRPRRRGLCRPHDSNHTARQLWPHDRRQRSGLSYVKPPFLRDDERRVRLYSVINGLATCTRCWFHWGQSKYSKLALVIEPNPHSQAQWALIPSNLVFKNVLDIHQIHHLHEQSAGQQ